MSEAGQFSKQRAIDRTAGTGVFAAIAGPSGAGKDSLMHAAAAQLADDKRFVFARRFITRPADGTEDFTPLTVQEWHALQADGGFSLCWDAHGLHYGLPVEIDAHIAAGRIVAANLSRAVIPSARARYARLSVILIESPLELRAARLASRGRETQDAALKRLSRAVPGFASRDADVVINNTGTIAEGGAALAAALSAL